MKQIQIVPFVEIQGIGAASGLVYHEQSLYIISDSSTFLYQYHLVAEQLHKIELLDSSQENLAKKEKADFESVTLYHNQLYIHGSGSTNQRQLRVKYHLATLDTQKKDLTKLYHRLRKSINLAADDLNIEGCIVTDDYYYFFQRGNGAQAQNGIFRYARKTKEVWFHPIVLPKIKGIEASFTDAILVDNTVYFLAACEDTTSTYNDGAVYGSFLGGLDLDHYAVLFANQITDVHKFEGLTFFQKTKDYIEFFLCEDNDTEEMHSVIYKVSVSL
jgi:hypothetical protein